MNKYSNVKTVVDGITFASKAEAARFKELQFLLHCGKIERCSRQMKFPLLVNGKKIGAYIADFVYWENGKMVVEDVKGFATPLYRWKKKHMLAQYGIEIIEVRGWNRSRSRTGLRRINDLTEAMVTQGVAITDKGEA